MADDDLVGQILVEAFPHVGQIPAEPIMSTEVDVGDGCVLEATCFAEFGHTLLKIARANTPATPEDEATELGVAWLEATWLRRADDGLLATADGDGRIVPAFVIPWAEATSQRISQSIDTLLFYAKADTAEPVVTESTSLSDEMSWIRI